MGSYTLLRYLVSFETAALLGVVVLTAACSENSSKSGGGDACSGSSSACTGGPVSDTGGPLPSWNLSVSPANLSTANDGKGVSVDVSGSALPLPDLAWLDGAIHLRNDATTDMVDAASSLNDVDSGETYLLTPKAPLPDGWYTVEIDGGDERVTVGGQSPEGVRGPDDLGGGKHRVHFRVGSEPHLLAIAACASTDLKLYPKLLLTFSELVNVPASPPVTALVNGGSSSLAVNSTPVKEDPLLHLRFEPAIPFDAEVAVTISSGMTAAASTIPVDLGTDAGSRTVELPAPQQGDTCRTWRETAIP